MEIPWPCQCTYALATLPLIKRISGGVTQVWYAGYACACGSISQLHIGGNISAKRGLALDTI